MKVSILRSIEIEVNGEEFKVLIHSLQSHTMHGGEDWPGEPQIAAEMRDAILDAEDRSRM